jgi:hypothetical protein
MSNELSPLMRKSLLAIQHLVHYDYISTVIIVCCATAPESLITGLYQNVKLWASNMLCCVLCISILQNSYTICFVSCQCFPCTCHIQSPSICRTTHKCSVTPCSMLRTSSSISMQPRSCSSPWDCQFWCLAELLLRSNLMLMSCLTP